MDSGSIYISPTIKLSPIEVNNQSDLLKEQTKISTEISTLITKLNAG